jgi:hypothetical protein
VTIRTGPVQEHEIGVHWSSLSGNNLMALLHMTGHAKQGHPLRKQALLPRAVAQVTVIAPLCDRRVLPQKRSSLFLVAAKAKCIRVGGREEVVTASTMRVVTRTALHAGSAVFITNQVCRAKPHGIPLCCVTAAAAFKFG